MRKKETKLPELQFPNAELLPEIVKMLNEGHTITLRLRGFSMRPFLEDNRDKALFTKPILENLKVGDPVLAETIPSHFVLHRIINIEGEKVTLLGDGNLISEHCKLEDIRGAIVGFYRKNSPTLDRIDGRKWKTYSTVWMKLRPIRRILLGFYRRLWIPLFGAI
jgi:hypothetical protein